MNPEEINKKAYEKYPEKLVWSKNAPGKQYGKIDINKDARDAFIRAYKEISALPTIKGWVARDGSGSLYLYDTIPHRDAKYDWWHPLAGRDQMVIEKNYFPDLRWEDEPIEVELPIIRN